MFTPHAHTRTQRRQHRITTPLTVPFYAEPWLGRLALGLARQNTNLKTVPVLACPGVPDALFAVVVRHDVAILRQSVLAVQAARRAQGQGPGPGQGRSLVSVRAQRKTWAA